MDGGGSIDCSVLRGLDALANIKSIKTLRSLSKGAKDAKQIWFGY